MPRTGYRLLPLLLVSLPLIGCAPLEPARLPDQSVIALLDGQAVPPDCSQFEEASVYRDGPLQLARRPTVAFGCATYTNLARMLARPADLVAPRRYAGQSGTNAGNAVQRYYDNKVTPFGNTGTTSISGSSGGSN